MKATFRFICRVVPALVFIFSGIVKAIDPVGGAIKFEDYFVAFHLDWLTPLALPLSIALASLEFLLGSYLLLGIYVRKLATVALALMSAFTVLTLYIAIFEPVSDCGCFGDAIKITNWQTFGKNVILLGLVLYMFLSRKHYHKGVRQVFFTAAALALYIVGLALWGINNLPVIDFRPFAVGTHIASGMEIPEGAERPEVETLFTLEKDGQQKIFTVDDYPYDDSTWVFVDSKTNIIREGFQPPLHDFHLMDSALEDATQGIVHGTGPQFLMIAPRLEKTSTEAIHHLAELAEESRQKSIPFYCITASGAEAAQAFDIQNKTMFRYLYSDETALKTMIRSNPGLILLYDGTIVGKWHYKNIPDTSILQNPLAHSMAETNRKNVILIIWANILGLILIPTVLLNRKTINKKK